MAQAPAFSILTPLLNRASMLPDMLASVRRQGDVAFEHLVVDGGSTDGSQAIAAGAGATVIDAPGSSIYEALNIGLARAQGGVICLLNSDDVLGDSALAAAARALDANAEVEIARGI